ncbi:uncharacterized protein CANTADRAFT_26171 [Suhomyces tanzawaensis NRRL Y-17324]|uniref:Uncharacterized protein n=1 Tax=Suhomyces tanzawaensis NRRL Y-17324 TaxID=984487 RepID=A0A1E4SI27_9ASCO|nr:uncharacterized protein CANTADRAFT_26171 [Suhomyces tanzawaensis NRRL Y-17324]ODV79130.1 hypothetical protein CANTADRAFT_26171 [Suhomyces tanzawaensis NRRL Y-17324]
MRAATRLFKHTPLIKFVGGPHTAPKNVSHAAKAHPMAPNGELPGSGSSGSSAGASYFNKNPVEPQNGEFFSRSQLSSRFRYKAPKEEEIDNVITGGAALVF